MLAAPLASAVAASLAKGDPLVAVLAGIILTQSAIIGWAVRLVILGRLVPGADRDYWREMAFEEQRQKRELMVTAQVARGVMQALPEPRSSGGGDPP